MRTMDTVVEESIEYLRSNEDLKYVLDGWINNGTQINLCLVTGRKLPPKYQEIMDGLEYVLGDAYIRTMSDMVLWRETSFPNGTIPTLTTVSSRSADSFCGCFGDTVYPIYIPKGTEIFYISAVDHLTGSDTKTEQEFLLERGTTRLQHDKLFFEPLKEIW